MSRPTPPTCRTTNGPGYSAVLSKRGSLLIWLDPETQWLAAPTGKRGRQPVFTDAAIQALFVCLSRSQLDYILRTWVRHCNVERPHRGRESGNNGLQVDFRPVRDGPIRRRRQLGGIITSCTRDAA